MTVIFEGAKAKSFKDVPYGAVFVYPSYSPTTPLMRVDLEEDDCFYYVDLEDGSMHFFEDVNIKVIPCTASVTVRKGE